MPKTIRQWFDEYSTGHQNLKNKRIHFICVPLIFFSLIGLLTYVHIFPRTSHHVFPFFNLGELIIIGGLIFYLRLSFPLFIGMAVISMITLFGNFYLAHYIDIYFPYWVLLIIVFILAWSGQFYGHRLEGEKPSFLTDLQFLMIGPAWILSFIYEKLRINY